MDIIKKLLALLMFLMICFSCKKREDNTAYTGRRYSIKVAKDTVKVNEMTKTLIYLAAPYSNSENTKIVVYLEADDYPISIDNDSIDYLPKLGFHNLEYDVDNQKWASSKLEYSRTSAIGKQFSTPGDRSLKGYILEYYKGDPLLDSVFDYSNTRKHFFEEKIYVIE